jgi:hypothetical protein
VPPAAPNPAASLIGREQAKQTTATQATETGYTFERGFPSGDTAQKAYNDADLNRAVETYRFFYPTVAGHGIFKGNERIGIVPNKVFGTLDSQPKHVGFTLNSDTPYAPAFMDLSDGPMVIELPPGPLICIVMDVNQLWIADLGLPGPAAGKGDKVVFLRPGYKEKPPARLPRRLLALQHHARRHPLASRRRRCSRSYRTYQDRQGPPSQANTRLARGQMARPYARTPGHHTSRLGEQHPVLA